MFYMRLRNLPNRCKANDIRKFFNGCAESVEFHGVESRVGFKGSEAEAVKFHASWNGKALGDRRIEMMIDWQAKQS